MDTNENAKALAEKIVKILDGHKAGDIKLYAVAEKTIIADYYVLCTGSSNTQVRGFEDEVEYKLGLEGISPARVEGSDTALWIVMDYSSVMVHIFNSESRKYYNLDNLLSDTEEIDISAIITEN